MKEIQKMHIKKGDQVKIISGAQKGLLGRILSVLTKSSSVIIEGVVPRVHYVKRSKVQNEEGKKKEIPISIHSSNVMLWDKETNQPSRIGYKFDSSKEKIEKKRYFKKSGFFVPESI